MKQLKIYFGKQQESILGSYADVIILDYVDDEEANNLVQTLTQTDRKWFGVKTLNGIKYINLLNVLWFDVINVEEKGDK